jgi:hypothetical protein
MLGLLSTLARRERVQAAQMLDERIATTLRTHSRHHQHDTVFALLQRQAELMPTLVDRLETMATTMAAKTKPSASACRPARMPSTRGPKRPTRGWPIPSGSR